MSIEKIAKGSELAQSKDLIAENILKLKELFPEAFTEGKIDFTVLRDVLGDEVETEEEYYRFTWAGKAQARREAHKPSTGTLRPCKEESVDWDSTENLYIEGDNLEVLKLLQKSYTNRVKMIYIDPPYNTGKDFVYRDNYKDNLKNYQQITSQINEDGNRLTTNSESDGRFHSNWLNMIYPRLMLARNLLKDDGVIFISIDDNEKDNLKKVCDEVFGETNFIANFIHKNNSNKNQAKLVSISTEYMLCYAKNIKSLAKDADWKILKKGAKDIVDVFQKLKAAGLSLQEIEEEIKTLYSRPKYSHLSRWNKVDEKGVFKDENLSREGGPKNYTIINPNTGKDCVIPERGWGKSLNDLLKLQELDLIWYGDENTPPGWKYYLDSDTMSVVDSFFYFDNSVDTKWIKKEFGSLVFDFPKPVEMLKLVQSLHLKDGDIMLDFFAGSSSSAHAILELKIERNINAKFIQIQLPESVETSSAAFKSGFHKINEIGKERIRRVIHSITRENPNWKKKIDLGFKVFKLDSSNIKGWDGNPDAITSSLFDAQENIKPERTEEDVLFEILLKYGLDLTLPIEERTIEGKRVFNVGLGALFICLADGITSKVAEGIGAWKEELNPETCRVIFKDSGFTDVEKTNSVQTLKRFGIHEIKSI